jgi:hypothetical protein
MVWAQVASSIFPTPRAVLVAKQLIEVDWNIVSDATAENPPSRIEKNFVGKYFALPHVWGKTLLYLFVLSR